MVGKSRTASVRHRAQLETGLVVQRELVDDVGAGAIVADDLDRAAFAAQAHDDLVERTDARDVPEMPGRHVDEAGGRGFIDLNVPPDAVARGEETQNERAPW